MSNRLVYLSGVHCSGKTTLLNKLLKNPRLKRAEQIQLNIIETDAFCRAFVRMSQYYIQALSHRIISNKNNTFQYLGDRCVFDTLIYTEAYYSLGWINEKQKKIIHNSFYYLFDVDILPQFIIYLCPPFQVVKKRLRERWKNGEVGWKERDFEYLRQVMLCYEECYALHTNVFRHKPTILKLVDTNLESNLHDALSFVLGI